MGHILTTKSSPAHCESAAVMRNDLFMKLSLKQPLDCNQSENQHLDSSVSIQIKLQLKIKIYVLIFLCKYYRLYKNELNSEKQTDEA